MFTMLLVILLMFKITNGQNTQCNDKYCLYEVERHYERISIEQAKSRCSQNGTNGWLLEVYDDKVDSLVWSLINQNKMSHKKILLGTKKFSKEWTWINDKTANVKIDNQVVNAVAYVSKSNDKRTFEYHAGDPTSKFDCALCLRKNTPNCTREPNWSHNGDCYYAIWGKFTWYEAYYECTEEGGSLAVFDELDLKDVNQTWVQILWEKKYWIGLSKSLHIWDKADIFMNYSRLTGKQQANSDECIVLSSGDNSISWLSLPCTGPYNIICMREKSPTVATQLPPKAQTNRPRATERTTSTTIFQPWRTTSTNLNNDKSSRHDSDLESTNKSPKISFEQHLGIGVGVSLFILILLLAVVLGVVCMRRNKFRTSQQSSIKQKHKKQQQQQQPSNDINLNNNTNNSNKHNKETVYSTVMNVNKPTATTTINYENNDTSEPNLIEYADLQFVHNINNDNNTNNIYNNANTNIKDNNQIINNENIYYNG